MAASVEELRSLEQNAPLDITEDCTLRAKIIDACGMTCVFCHNEGTPVAASGQFVAFPTRGSRVSVFADNNGVSFMPGTMQPDESYRKALQVSKDTMDLRELHFTGGEPTLHPYVHALASIAVEQGYAVKLTSNGETGGRRIAELASAGVEKINFSVFGTTPEELAETQHSKYKDIDLAQRKIEKLDEAVVACKDNGIKADMNLVVRGKQDIERAIQLIRNYGDIATIRLLDDLTAPDAIAAIYELLANLDATPISRSITAGSSNTRSSFEIPGVGNHVSFKQIRQTRLPGSCDDCQFDNECQEGFYGARLYVNKAGRYMLGICIQRMDLTVPMEEFISSGVPESIRKYRVDDMAELRSKHSIS